MQCSVCGDSLPRPTCTLCGDPGCTNCIMKCHTCASTICSTCSSNAVCRTCRFSFCDMHVKSHGC